MDALVALVALGAVVGVWFWLARTMRNKGRGWFVRHLAGSFAGMFAFMLVSMIAVGTGLVSPEPKEEQKVAEVAMAPETVKVEQAPTHAGTLSEVVEAVANEAPASAYTVDSTKYLAVVFDSTNVTRDYHLLTTKRLMPVLLDRYPEIDQFFLAWSKDGAQFLKIQFERDAIQHMNWKVLSVKDGDLQKASSMYWAIPALR